MILSIEATAADLCVLEKVEVKYVTLPGWKTSISSTRSFEELPENTKKYIEFIEKEISGGEVKIEWIGVGPERESMIHRK